MRTISLLIHELADAIRNERKAKRYADVEHWQRVSQRLAYDMIQSGDDWAVLEANGQAVGFAFKEHSRKMQTKQCLPVNVESMNQFPLERRPEDE